MSLGSYFIQAKYVPIGNPILKNVTSNKIGPKTLELSGLEDGYSYTIWIEACVDGIGKCMNSTSETETMSCDFQDTPDQPTHLTVPLDQISRTNAVLQWKRPQNVNLQCIKDYNVTLIQHCPDSNEMCQCTKKDSVIAITNETKIELTDLVPWTKYSVHG